MQTFNSSWRASSCPKFAQDASEKRRKHTEEFVVVTGATGGVGAKVVAQLLADGKNVRAVVRDPSKAEKLLVSSSTHCRVSWLPISHTPKIHEASLSKRDLVLYAG